jgi:hypothetical protein
MTRLFRGAVVTLTVAVAGPFALAQTTGVTLSGSVRDNYTRDGYLPAATVTVTSHRSGDTVTILTSPEGMFFLPGLEPGVYTIAISKPGYESLVTRSFCIVSGKPARFDVALGPARGGTRSAGVSPPDRRIVAAPPVTPLTGAMTPSEIEEAMAFGRGSSKLTAPRLTETGWLIPRRLGVLFTPFWRVATMAQIAAASNEPLSEREIPLAFIQKLAWIIAPPASYFLDDEGESPEHLITVARIVIRPKRTTPPANDIEPTWRMYVATECDRDMLQSVLGPQVTHQATVAAFPMDAIAAGNAIVFTYSPSAFPRGSLRGTKVEPQIRRVVIRESDLRQWR